MPSELTNLLPPERQARLVREYHFRLGAVIALIFSLLVCVAGILLIPIYIVLSATTSLKETQLVELTSKLSSANEVTVASRLAVLSSNAEALAALSKRSSVSALVRVALALPRTGILLTGFARSAAADTTPGTLAISGTAGTRDALRSYQLVLEKASFVRSADLPVSVYAKDANIPFTIILTLRP